MTTPSLVDRTQCLIEVVLPQSLQGLSQWALESGAARGAQAPRQRLQRGSQYALPQPGLAIGRKLIDRQGLQRSQCEYLPGMLGRKTQAATLDQGLVVVTSPVLRVLTPTNSMEVLPPSRVMNVLWPDVVMVPPVPICSCDSE